MKPRPGVPFSWYFKGTYDSKDHGKVSSIRLRESRLPGYLHNVGYYKSSTTTWSKAGEWGNVVMREYFGHYYGLTFFRSQSLLINGNWRIE
jgi:hypothetical protein